MSDRYESHMEMMARHDRAERCMAACAGIAEPEKAIPALVEALRTLQFNEHAYQCSSTLCTNACDKARAALALVQPSPAVQTIRERELQRAAKAEAALANDPDLESHIEEKKP